ncbi:hypothetical protein L1049_020301 [Liquidambar formosana]|uniref:Glycosyl transferase CAP10 domain-containing protein n=1 Tax=Liquidambar formosana TaxID=63359 RepID=A0AAP0S7A7_LIQFO
MREQWYGSGVYRHFKEMMWRPLMKAPARSSAFFSFFFLLLFFGGFISTRLIDTTTTIAGDSAQKSVLTTKTTHIYPHKPDEIPKKPRKKIEIPLNCTALNLTRTCPSNYPTTSPPEDPDRPSPPQCPDYFRWIHEDLRPWKATGITRRMVESAKTTANFRLVVLNGRVYMERYRKSFQTRDTFTLWGVIQLLRRYPGKIPDLELMFDCVDWPVIKSEDYRGPNATDPPPLFRYCGDDATLDIVFPDWSFWGWSEINIKPWESLLKDLKEGNKRTSYFPLQAQVIGKAASDFIQEDLKMDYVYDYMFHLLNEYAKLLRFKPRVPRKAIEICSEKMACTVEGLEKKFMMESLVKGPTDTSPCAMPPPYDPPALHAFRRRKENSIKQVEIWEKKYWDSQSK